MFNPYREKRQALKNEQKEMLSHVRDPNTRLSAGYPFSALRNAASGNVTARNDESSQIKPVTARPIGNLSGTTNELNGSNEKINVQNPVKRSVLGSFGNIFTKLARNPSAPKLRPQNEASGEINTSNTPGTQRPIALLSPGGFERQNLMQLESGREEKEEGNDQHPKFVGKFTTDSLFKKISNNLQQNKAIEDMINTQKKAVTSPQTQLRFTAALKKRSNIMHEKGGNFSIELDANLSRIVVNFPGNNKLGEIRTNESKEIIDRRLEKSLGRRSTSRQRGSSVDVKEALNQTYYMKALKYYLGLKNKPPIGSAYCEHFLQSIAAIKYVQKLRPVSDEAILKSRVNCPKMNEELSASRPG